MAKKLCGGTDVHLCLQEPRGVSVSQAVEGLVRNVYLVTKCLELGAETPWLKEGRFVSRTSGADVLLIRNLVEFLVCLEILSKPRRDRNTPL